MRKVILSAALTLDGMIARPDGSFDFIPPSDPECQADNELAQLFASVDVIAMGRKTLDDVRRHTGEGPPPIEGETYIFSRTEPPGERGGLIYTSQPPTEWLAGIRGRAGKNIFLMGGGELAAAFLAEDLVDEMLLAVIPVLLGDGVRLFNGGFSQRNLELIESQSDKSGLVSLKYRRTRG